ncbi:DUF1173 domain-containing protein [Phyllobacterium endophyticum]|uniref:DUF1173 domain-containing protein n=1 Tax=Phyllobacterium endophyticum TaxID=1149773 RepID=UPI0011C97DAB|nr:DUF1173 domain-containing protein [Phyllobacterium endophyticum]TXR49502.1 DUF1173 domain-containing protein [Phyllobacterium endophyticum]
MPRRFHIGDGIFEDQAADLPERLNAAYVEKLRPLCLCRNPGIPMYVARIGDQFVIKRMPLSGGAHDPRCESYESPYELTGLGPLVGSAIQIDHATGCAALKLDFSLTKRGPRTLAGNSGAESPSAVNNESRKLSLRALLHYLWHEGGLTEWTSLWIGRRHWWHVRSHIVEAASTMTIRGKPLVDRLFVPEPFRAEDKTAIEQRRAMALAGIHRRASGPPRLMLLIGEIKEFCQARSGRKVVIKHMPGFPLFIDDTSLKLMQRRFSPQLELWQANEASRLMAIMTIGANGSGLTMINEIALMTVTGEWLPVESVYEERVLEKLTRMRQKSVKALRFNLPAAQPVAVATLPEAKPKPVALYVVPPDAGDDFESVLAHMIDARPDVRSWIWRIHDGDMPALPQG